MTLPSKETIVKFAKAYGYLLLYTSVENKLRPFHAITPKLDADLDVFAEARNILMEQRHFAQAFLNNPRSANLDYDRQVIHSVQRAIFTNWVLLSYTKDTAICFNPETQQYYSAHWLEPRKKNWVEIPALIQFALVPYAGFWFIDGFYFCDEEKEFTIEETAKLANNYHIALQANEVIGVKKH